MRALCPPPDQLLRHLLDDGRAAPLAVLDPTWPAGLRAAATAELTSAVARGRVRDDDLVLFTSGSSGRPRGVVRTAASWRASLPPLTSLTGLGADDVVWVPGPLTSSLSLYGAYHAAGLGARVVTGPLARLRADDARAVTAVHLVPTLLTQLASTRRRGQRLPSLRTVVVAGEPLAAARWDDAPGRRLVEYYGAAELSFVAARTAPGPMRAFGDAEVRVVDGEVWVRSPYLARGYLRPDDDGPLRRDGAWATVGDRGAQAGAGLTVTGRGGTAVSTGGHTVVVEEVEAALAGVPGVLQVVVLGLPDDRLGQVLAAVVVLDGDGTADGTADGRTRARLEAAARSLPPPARPVRWLTAAGLPLTTAGKVARAQVAALAGGLARLR